MVWVLVFGAVALIGIITVLSYAIWLWHKATDLFSEVEMLGRRAEELAALAGQIRLPGEDASRIGDDGDEASVPSRVAV